MPNRLASTSNILCFLSFEQNTLSIILSFSHHHLSLPNVYKICIDYFDFLLYNSLSLRPRIWRTLNYNCNSRDPHWKSVEIREICATVHNSYFCLKLLEEKLSFVIKPRKSKRSYRHYFHHYLVTKPLKYRGGIPLLYIIFNKLSIATLLAEFTVNIPRIWGFNYTFLLITPLLLGI